jgi:hypothetical protein
MKSMANRKPEAPLSVRLVADVHRELLLKRKEACHNEDDPLARWIVTARDRL